MREIIMPKLSPTMEMGTIVRWLKREGDWVEAGEIFLEIETDKAVNEVEASDSGTLGKILVDEGEAVNVLQVLGYILEPGENAPDEWPLRESLLPASASNSAVGPSVPEALPMANGFAPEYRIDLEQVGDTGESGQIAESSAGARRPRKVSPRAKRLAEEKGISLDLIRGSGLGGQIMEQDILEHISSPNVILPSRLQKITGERMSTSFTNAPHFYLKIEVDASRLVEWRTKLLPVVQRTSGVRLTFTDLLVPLVAQTLINHPRANASWENGRIRTFEEINIGLAVAVEGGLIVPVLRRADQMTVEEIVRGRKALVEKAAAGTLSLDDLEGGTFTLTNLGMLGIDEFMAIINPPQSAILAVGRIAERVMAENGQVVVKPVVHLVLSVDHRVLDGADGARFLGDLKRAIEDPDDMFKASFANSILS